MQNKRYVRWFLRRSGAFHMPMPVHNGVALMKSVARKFLEASTVCSHSKVQRIFIEFHGVFIEFRPTFQATSASVVGVTLRDSESSKMDDLLASVN